MKILASLFLVFTICLSAKAQDSITVDRPVTPPTIVVAFDMERPLRVGNHTIRLKKIIDSRCPNGVECVWAGEVKAVVDILEDGKFVEEKTINLSARNPELLTFLKTEELAILGHSVKPYPSVDSKIQQGDYKVNIVIDKLLEN